MAEVYAIDKALDLMKLQNSIKLIKLIKLTVSNIK